MNIVYQTPKAQMFIECKAPHHKLHSLIIPCIAIILFSRYYIASYPGSRWVGLGYEAKYYSAQRNMYKKFLTKPQQHPAHSNYKITTL